MATAATVLVEAQDCVTCCQLGPYQGVCSILAYGTESLLAIAELSTASKSLRKIKSFQHGTAVTTLAWSPVSHAARRYVICTAGADNMLRIFDTDCLASNEDTAAVKLVLQGHRAPINSCTFSADGSTVVSGSDDGTARLWSADTGLCIRTIALRSACMSVSWFPGSGGTEESMQQFLVAEQQGSLHFLHQETFETTFALHAPKEPLESADWGANGVYVVGGGRLAAWEGGDILEVPSHAVDEGAARVRSSRNNLLSSSTLVAVAGTRKTEFFRMQDGGFHSILKLSGAALDASWHLTQSLCVVAQGSRLVLVQM